MYGDSMPDHRTECIIYRCEDGGDSVSSDDYSADSDADSGEVDN